MAQRTRTCLDCDVLPPFSIKLCCLHDAAEDMQLALEAFVTLAARLQGFPQAYEPYSGALVAARAALRKAKGES